MVRTSVYADLKLKRNHCSKNALTAFSFSDIVCSFFFFFFDNILMCKATTNVITKNDMRLSLCHPPHYMKSELFVCKLDQTQRGQEHCHFQFFSARNSENLSGLGCHSFTQNAKPILLSLCSVWASGCEGSCFDL